MKKIILMIFSGIIVAALVIGFFIYSNLNIIVGNMIEKYGSEITAVRVHVGKVQISPASGEGGVNRLTIGNPPGYKSANSIIMKQIDVEADVKSFMSDLIIIEDISVENPEITYELGSGSSNFKTIQKNVNSYKPKKERKDGKKKNVEIRNLSITGGTITVLAPTLNQNFQVALPDMKLNNLGQGSKDGNIPEVTQQVMATITSAVMAEVGKITIDNFSTFMLNSSGGVLKGAGEGVMGVTDGVGQSVEDITKGIFGGGN